MRRLVSFAFAMYVRAMFAAFGVLMIWDGMTIGEATDNIPKVVLNTAVAVVVIAFPFAVVFPTGKSPHVDAAQES